MMTLGGSNSMSAAAGMLSSSTIEGPLLVRRRYSSMLSSTWAGLPRSVMNTGPSCAAFWAADTSRLNSRLVNVWTVTMRPFIKHW